MDKSATCISGKQFLIFLKIYILKIDNIYADISINDNQNISQNLTKTYSKTS